MMTQLELAKHSKAQPSVSSLSSTPPPRQQKKEREKKRHLLKFSCGHYLVLRSYLKDKIGGVCIPHTGKGSYTLI